MTVPIAGFVDCASGIEPLPMRGEASCEVPKPLCDLVVRGSQVYSSAVIFDVAFELQFVSGRRRDRVARDAAHAVRLIALELLPGDRLLKRFSLRSLKQMWLRHSA